MAGCCDPRGCDRFFGRRFAARAAKRYRKRGLDETAQQMVAFLESHDIADATVLEIGGGIGDIQIELLRRGAARSTNLELSPGYDDEARALLVEAGLEGRSVRLIRDIAEDASGIEPADVVVLNRVVCCYPDYERLLTAAAEHAQRLLVFSYPRRNWISRLVVTTQNLLFATLRKEFRTFTHPPSAMLAVLEARGLTRAFAQHGTVWQVAGLERFQASRVRSVHAPEVATEHRADPDDHPWNHRAVGTAATAGAGADADASLATFATRGSRSFHRLPVHLGSRGQHVGCPPIEKARSNAETDARARRARRPHPDCRLDGKRCVIERRPPERARVRATV